MQTQPDTEFQREWAHYHGERRPLGWLLRQDDDLPWVRFHALPDSKRYAENDRERQIILERANQLGDRLLGAGAECWLVESNPVTLADGAIFTGTYAEDDDFECSFYAYPVRWQAGGFDALIAAIADDMPGRALWMSRKSGNILAPYDGGFDCFLASRRDILVLKVDFGIWLSPEPSGL